MAPAGSASLGQGQRGGAGAAAGPGTHHPGVCSGSWEVGGDTGAELVLRVLLQPRLALTTPLIHPSRV